MAHMVPANFELSEVRRISWAQIPHRASLDHGGWERSIKTACRVIAFIALAIQAPMALPADTAWMLNYAGRSTNALIWDKRTKAVIGETLPSGFSSDVLDGLGGPSDPVFVVGSSLSASACVPHSCPDLGFFWIDTRTGTAFGAHASVWGCDRKNTADLPCELTLGSRVVRYQEIPAQGRRALMDWMSDHGVRVKVVRFIDAAGKITDLDPADFRLPDRFEPPSTGPSFDCRKAKSRVEIAVCEGPTLAKLDLEMGELYEQMRLGYDTVGNREQLRNLQRNWMARRSASCPDGPNLTRCLEVEYRRQLDVLWHWIPMQEARKK